MAVQYPNGDVFTTSALTPAQMNVLWQQLTCAVLGINPIDPSRVRINWQTQGQPFTPSPAGPNVCYIACVPLDVEYSKVRDMDRAQVDNSPQQIVKYTKGWRISWIFYGSDSEAQAQLVWSGMFQDYLNNQLDLSNLYLVTEFDTPQRVPEIINAQWWERADFSVTLYEQVTETLTTSAATSVEVKVYDNQLGQVADISA
jgi:hypothetical protein